MQEFKFCPICSSELKWDQIDGRKRLNCPECGWINYRNPIPVIQCLVSNKNGEVLLIKRGVEPYKGHWLLPGGFVEIDETVEEAGERELLEETNLKGRPGRLLGIYLQKSRTYEYVMVIGVEFITDKDDPAPGDDAAEVAYFSKENLPEIPFQSHLDLISAFYS